VFLDMAWTRADEEAFQRLRRVPDYQTFVRVLEGTGDSRPRGLRLLDLLMEGFDAASNRLTVYVVTAYKSPYLIRYLREKYRGLVKGNPFMKWSDEVRLATLLPLTL
jgi:hypothetical protein